MRVICVIDERSLNTVTTSECVQTNKQTKQASKQATNPHTSELRQGSFRAGSFFPDLSFLVSCRKTRSSRGDRKREAREAMRGMNTSTGVDFSPKHGAEVLRYLKSCCRTRLLFCGRRVALWVSAGKNFFRGEHGF